MACKECLKTKRDKDEKKMKENAGVAILSVVLTLMLVAIIVWMTSSDFYAYQIMTQQDPITEHQLLGVVAILAAITGMEITVSVLMIELVMKQGVEFGRKYSKEE